MKFEPLKLFVKCLQKCLVKGFRSIPQLPAVQHMGFCLSDAMKLLMKKTAIYGLHSFLTFSRLANLNHIKQLNITTTKTVVFCCAIQLN